MFNLTSFQNSKGADTGILGSALAAVRSLLTQLLHSPETGVVQLTVDNDDNWHVPAPVPYANLISIVPVNYTGAPDNPYTCTLAGYDDGSEIFLPAVAVCIDKKGKSGIAPSQSGYFRFNGVADVAMEQPGATPYRNGDIVYSSQVNLGKGTNIRPMFGRKVGWIVDDSNYSINGTVRVLLEFDDVIGVFAFKKNNNPA